MLLTFLKLLVYDILVYLFKYEDFVVQLFYFGSVLGQLLLLFLIFLKKAVFKLIKL